MKRIILLTLLIPVLAHAQRYGHTSAGAAGAGSTANVRANTGWTASGTLARDTLYTNYAIFGAKTFGVGGTTQAQNARAKFNVLGRAANDTLAIWSNEGNTSANGDSAVYILPNGAMSIGSTTLFSGLASDARLKVGGGVYVEGGYIAINGANPQIQLNSSAQRIYYDATNKMQFYVSGAAAHVMDDNGYVGINNGGLKSRNQGVLTVRGNGTTDSLAVFRNDKNATLDSTAIILKDGSFVTGEWRIRSGADSLVFHHDGVPIFAILPDGTTADLVAGTPPTLWRNGPPQEYIWLLRIGVLLLLLLVAFKVYEYAKPRIREHKTLPSEI